LTDEELAQAYNQLDLLVQPEGDEALEALMGHIRDMKQVVAKNDAIQCHQERLLTLLAQARTAMLLLAKEMDTDLWYTYLATPVAKIGDMMLESETWQEGYTE
jgi:hypothetical protein